MTIKDIVTLLLQNDNYEILTHNYPDGDCLGSGYGLCLALQSMGKNARVLTSPMAKNLEFLKKGVKIQQFDAEFVISVDVAGASLLGEYQEDYQDKINLCIDHHALNTVEVQYKYVDSTCAAASEIIYQIIREMGVKITPEIADCLYTGISTDTGCFCYTNTTPQTLRIAADLLECGCNNHIINKELFQTKSKKRLEIEREIYENIIYCCNDKCAIICVTQEMENSAEKEDLEGLASIPREIQGVQMGVCIREKQGGEYKVSVRTQGDIDACEFCKQFGGGGHKAASGCTLTGTLQSAVDTIKTAAEKIL